ncbi:Ras family protein [Aphelenchoides avenae]|nr:Ras family protein [Aphelenchus avenae]
MPVSPRRSPQKPFKAKVVMVGDTGVGKTSILLRHDGQGFTSKISPTLGASFVTSRTKYNGRDVELSIWDTAGQERFRSMVPMYLRNAAAAILVFEISRRQTYENLGSWIDELTRSGSESLQLFVMGNKSDLDEFRAVSEEEGHQFAENHNACYFETSALNGKGIEMAMRTIAEELVTHERTSAKDLENVGSVQLHANRTNGEVSDNGSGSSNGKSRWCCALM